jgi:hypothetical protein
MGSGRPHSFQNSSQFLWNEPRSVGAGFRSLKNSRRLDGLPPVRYVRQTAIVPANFQRFNTFTKSTRRASPLE